jgi:hypothetical protein
MRPTVSDIKAITDCGTTLLGGMQGGAWDDDDGADQARGCFERRMPARMYHLFKMTKPAARMSAAKSASAR